VEINRTDAGIYINRTITPDEAYLGDTLEVRTRLKKIGFLDITNISFADTYSSDFEIEASSGCPQVGNAITWKGDMNKTSEVYCTYKLKPIHPVDLKNVAQLNYSILKKPQHKTSNYTFNISQAPLQLNISYRNSSLKIDQQFFGNLSIKSLKDFTLRKMNISFSDKVTIVNYTDLQKVQNTLLYNGEFPDGTYKNMTFIVTSKFAGLHKVDVSLEYSYGGKIKTVARELILNYTSEIVYLDFYNSTNVSVLRISNPKDLKFKDISIKVNNDTFFMSALDEKKYKEFFFPLMQGKQKIDLTYKSVYGQEFTKSYELAYGESTNPKYEKEVLTEQKETVKAAPKEEKKKITIDPKIISLVVLIVSISIIVIFLFNFIRSKIRKSELDREIDRIKKEAEEMNK
jgi:hypothetical protein